MGEIRISSGGSTDVALYVVADAEARVFLPPLSVSGLLQSTRILSQPRLNYFQSDPEVCPQRLVGEIVQIRE